MDNIKGFIETSFVDWPARTCAVLFLGGCNFRCPFCHNHPLVLNPAELVSFPIAKIIGQLRPLKKWLGGVTVSGGEPTLDPDLPELLKILRQEGFATKIDTNGSQPEILADLLQQGLLDMVAMDVKTVLVQEKYDRCTGTRTDLAKIRQSIELIRQSGIDHEFRMTILPRLHTREDMVLWAAGPGAGSPLKLQNYNPRSPLSPDVAGERGFSPEEFEELVKLVTPQP
jgi:pyruvate formate lyase activating enzyme